MQQMVHVIDPTVKCGEGIFLNWLETIYESKQVDIMKVLINEATNLKSVSVYNF